MFFTRLISLASFLITILIQRVITGNAVDLYVVKGHRDPFWLLDRQRQNQAEAEYSAECLMPQDAVLYHTLCTLYPISIIYNHSWANFDPAHFTANVNIC